MQKEQQSVFCHYRKNGYFYQKPFYFIMKKFILLIGIILPFVFISCGDDNDEPESKKKHDYVDLGLPSGALWATCNIGANTPEEYGYYFAWGETKPKDVYSEENYKWPDYSKYNNTDNKTVLDPEDDAATVNWGSQWRMPTKEEQDDLCKYCTWQWTQRNGVNGYWVTGPNGKSIFLPAAGQRVGSTIESEGTFGMIWSRTGSSNYAYYLFFSPGGERYEHKELTNIRYFGFTVRAVRVWQN